MSRGREEGCGEGSWAGTVWWGRCGRCWGGCRGTPGLHPCTKPVLGSLPSTPAFTGSWGGVKQQAWVTEGHRALPDPLKGCRGLQLPAELPGEVCGATEAPKPSSFCHESSGGGTTPAAVVLPAFTPLGEGSLCLCLGVPWGLSILLAWDRVSTGERRAVTPLAKYFLLRCGCWAFWSQKARAAPSNLMSSVPVSLLGRRCWSQATPRTMWRKSFPMAWMRAVAQTRKRTVSARSQGSCAPCLSRVGSAGGAAWDPRDCAEPKCDLVARRSCVGSSGKRARVQHCLAATLAQLFSVCRAVGSTPCPVLCATS